MRAGPMMLYRWYRMRFCIDNLGRENAYAIQGRLHFFFLPLCVPSIRMIDPVLEIPDDRFFSRLPPIVDYDTGNRYERLHMYPRKYGAFSSPSLSSVYGIIFLVFSLSREICPVAESPGSMIGYAMCYFWHTLSAVSKKHLA